MKHAMLVPLHLFWLNVLSNEMLALIFQ